MTNENISINIQGEYMGADETHEVVKDFIVLEGLDGAGTTTQATALADRLREHGSQAIYTCEPTTSVIGEVIRSILKGEREVARGTLAKLFAADRHNHLYQHPDGIIPVIGRGSTVVSDRYLFSSLAYQSLDWPFDDVWALNADYPLPEHLLFIDVPPEECFKRLQRRSPDREIYDAFELQEEIRNTYYHVFSLLRDTGMNIHIFDGTLSQEKLAESIWMKIASFR
jgi:dTMP kinase